jgi:2-iminobutanoate/2-iminopropanoate deaminase
MPAHPRLQPITTSKAPSAIGPYSQGVEAGGFVFVSGQIPIDPSSGEVIASDIGAQTERVLENVAAVLRAAGLLDGGCRENDGVSGRPGRLRSDE